MEHITWVENTSEKNKKRERIKEKGGTRGLNEKRYLRGTVRPAFPAARASHRFEHSIDQTNTILLQIKIEYNRNNTKKRKRAMRYEMKRYDSPPIHAHMMSGKLLM